MNQNRSCFFSIESPKHRFLVLGERKICFSGYFFDCYGRKANQILIKWDDKQVIVNRLDREDVQRLYAQKGIAVEKAVGFESCIELSRGLKEVDVIAELSCGEKIKLKKFFFYIWSKKYCLDPLYDNQQQLVGYYNIEKPLEKEVVSTQHYLEVSGSVVDKDGYPPRLVQIKTSTRKYPCQQICRKGIQKDYPFIKDNRCGFAGYAFLEELPKQYSIEVEFLSGQVAELATFFASLKVQEDRREKELYKKWFSSYGQFVGREEELLRRRLKGFAYKPIFSVVMVVGLGDRLEGVLATVRSVVGQWYEQWELLLVLYGGRKLAVEELRGVGGEGKLKVIEVDSSEKVKAKEVGVREACGEYCLLLDSGEELVAHALYVFVEALQEDKRLDLLFGDEDQLSDGGEVHSPVFKPGFNYDLLRSVNYLGRPVVFRKQKAMEVGGFDEGLEGAEEWDLYLRMTTDRVDGHGVCHLPYVLCHRGGEAVARGGVVKEEVEREVVWRDCTRRGVGVERIERLKGGWRIRYGIGEAKPLVSIVMPSKCQLTYLRPCVESIMSKTSYDRYELLLVVNEKRLRNAEVRQYLEGLSGGEGKVRLVVYPDEPFNYAKINNAAVREARGEVLALLNDDLEVITGDWLEEMVGHAMRAEVGAVGAMLYYPDGTIQHAGVILAERGIPDHRLRNVRKEEAAEGGYLWYEQNLSAVTAACVVMRKACFMEVGGFDESYAIDLNDIDLCLRLRQRGYLIVWTPFAEFYHYESVSKMADIAEQYGLWSEENSKFIKKWLPVFPLDPYYNPNLSFKPPYYKLSFPPRVTLLPEDWETEK